MPGTDVLIVELYPHLRGMARREHVRSGSPMTLQTTALIHETYLKLQRRSNWQSRAHFLGCAATAMRHVLIDGARARLSAKRQAPEPDGDEGAKGDVALLTLNDVLQELAQLEPDLARLVECRFFAGYDEAETAEILGVSGRTVRRNWTRARAWIHARMMDDGLDAGIVSV
ncbi:ECF-type sigma factor [Sphingomonas sp. RP10(2022)]|uniref:ECF-type sigma factor n=1 Tax=Sphingomonas liriopis TaxID=2949094 RepID=A0A9X2HRP9_9SPHN|nr:ECF-type sigma factor [Sphingomonas liriopis]MCP3734647.1 ECF-type sigma factor [Sphingomonas liriopis]